MAPSAGRREASVGGARGGRVPLPLRRSVSSSLFPGGKLLLAPPPPPAAAIDVGPLADQVGATGRQRTFDRLGKFLSSSYDPADFALRLLHKDVSLAVGLGREVGVPMRLANLALEELTEALNRGWSTRDSRVGMLLQVERSKITPPTVDPQKVSAVLANDN